ELIQIASPRRNRRFLEALPSAFHKPPTRAPSPAPHQYSRRRPNERRPPVKSSERPFRYLRATRSHVGAAIVNAAARYLPRLLSTVLIGLPSKVRLPGLSILVLISQIIVRSTNAPSSVMRFPFKIAVGCFHQMGLS